MKKNLIATLATVTLLAAGAAFAQATATHGVDVRIPAVLSLRITTGTGNAAASNPAVVFDFTSGQGFTDYLAALDSGFGWIAPTTVTNFGDVVVFANRGTWSVAVSASTIGFLDNVVLGELPAGVNLADIVVTPTGAIDGTFVATRSADWSLAGGPVAAGIATQGWRSLGFSGDDYAFYADGDEAPGTYTTVVTYTITAP
jgi:hypothetical protein